MVQRYLELIAATSDALGAGVRSLTPAAWDGPTNCPPWRVRDLVTHVVHSGQGFVDNVRRGLTGDTQPGHGSDGSLQDADPSTVADALAATTAEFIGLYQGLDATDLEKICFHRRGNRSVRWYAAHRLAELAFHAWDFQVSTGQTPTLDEQVALLLLPTLLESNVPRTYAAGLSTERGAGERYALVVADEPRARWSITIDAEALTTRAGDTAADLSITGSAAHLALLAYGRLELPGLVRSGRVVTRGDKALVDRFARIFPRP